MSEKISIVIPVIRPEGASWCIQSIRKKGGLPEAQYEIVSEIDSDRIGCPKMLKRLVAQAKHDLVMFLGDDTEVREDCLKHALKAMRALPDGWGLVGLNDQYHNILPTHWLASKRLLKLLDGEFFNTGYAHQFCDVELMDRVKEMGRYILCKDAKIKHNHPIVTNNRDDLDADYDRIYSKGSTRQDWKLYRKRRHARLGESLSIALPLVDDKVSVSFMVSFILMEKPQYTLLMPRFPVGNFALNHAELRNDLVKQALKNHCSHVLMLDTDQAYPSDAISKLIKHAEAGLDVVGAPVHRSWPPFDPILYRGRLGHYVHVPDDECYSGDLVEVDATGCGCIMYATRVFEEMEPPWFTTPIDDRKGRQVGEDIGMSWRLRCAGHRIYIDTSIKDIEHMVTYGVKRETYELYKKMKHAQYKQDGGATECFKDYDDQQTPFDVLKATHAGWKQ